VLCTVARCVDASRLCYVCLCSVSALSGECNDRASSVRLSDNMYCVRSGAPVSYLAGFLNSSDKTKQLHGDLTVTALNLMLRRLFSPQLVDSHGNS